MCFTDLDFIFLWCFDFKIEPIFATDPVESKNDNALKVVKIDSKTIISLPWSKSVKHTVQMQDQKSKIILCFFNRYYDNLTII